MSRDPFAEVVRRASALRTAGRRWEVWPVSIGAHALLVGWLFAMPLVAPAMLPALPSPFVAFITRAEPPPLPPAPRRVSVRELPESLKRNNAAPADAPSGVAPESGIEAIAPEAAAAALDTGTVIGVEGGLPTDSTVPPPTPAPPEPPKRIGGDIVAPTRVLYVSPAYPPIAIAARVEGVVIVEATISRDGAVEDARVLRSVALLDAAALDAVRQWRYTPTRLNGVPVRVIMTVTVHFTLKQEA